MSKKTLVVVESPSKAHTIQNYLGDQYTVIASKGHICDLAKTGKYNLGVDIDNKFQPRYVLDPDKLSILDQIIKLAQDSDRVLLASDNDKEGEAIAWHIANRLQGLDKPIKRIVFNEIKKAKILKAIKEARDIDMNIFHAQEARRILDRIVGFMASPFIMKYFGNNLSAGRVQSVVTRLVIDREKEIEVFIPEDFWTINVSLSKDNQEGFIAKYSGRPTDLKTAEDMKKRLSSNKEYIISEVLSQEESKSPDAPMITSTLQRIMAKEHGFGAERTMKAAQSLYENSFCTYIRTDSKRIGDEALSDVRDYLKDNNFIIPKKPNIFKNKDAAQDAHECIRPTDLNLLPKNSGLIGDEKKVYEMIWKYFVASQMLPAVYSTLRVTAHVKNDKTAEVKASGKALKSKGFLEILEITDNSKIEIPNLSKGDNVFLFGKDPVKMEKKQTQPPPRYSEDKLLKELEQKSIGRPSTFAELLSKISTRNYVEKKGNVYHATDLGKKVTDELSKFFGFMDYNFTSNIEKQLDEIEYGKLDHIDMLSRFYPQFKKELDAAYVKHGCELCEKCSAPMIIKTAKASQEKFLGCQNFPFCKNVKSLTKIA